MRKHYTAAFKARVVQELLKEEKTLGQIAAAYKEAERRGVLRQMEEDFCEAMNHRDPKISRAR